MSLQEIDPKQLKLIQQRFSQLSEQRLLRMLDNFNMLQVDCIRLLPFLFHVNQPMLPGYVDKQTPCGIPNYSPGALEKKIAKSISRSFEYQPRAYLSFEIAGLYLMGSTGTLAQSTKSDLDLWICLSGSVTAEATQKLLQKVELISAFFDSKGIELNCYLVFEHQFTQQTDKTIGQDSCGNTQNFLLLDEFYRTAIWMCGRQPLWWIVPPSQNYLEFTHRLLNDKHVEKGDWLNFGDISQIPPAEYFSSALWQLYKAIESPFKSSLKLLVLEIYARYFPQTGLLSSQYKKLVYQGDQSFDQLDPYVLILNNAEEFLRDQPQRLEFLRRAFYLKTGVKIILSKDNPKNWRYQKIKQLVQRWRWKQPRLDYLNDRVNWRVNAVIRERVDLVRELNHSYHFLSNFGRLQGVLDRDSQQELVALGRMLYATFERRSGKIEKVNTGIARNLSEASMTLQFHQQQWRLFLGAVKQQQLVIHQPVYQAESFFAVLSWCVCNQLVSRQTNFHIYCENSFYSRQLANQLVRDLIELTDSAAPKLGEAAFSKAAHTIKMGIHLNTDLDPLQAEKVRGIYSISGQQDGFCWGEYQLNLFPQFDVFWINSWGEYCCKKYSGDSAWIDFFTEHREVLVKNEQGISFFAGNLLNPDTHQQRVFSVLRLWSKLTNESRSKHKATRFMMSVGKKYLRVDFQNKQVVGKVYPNAVSLLSSLSELLAGKPHHYLDDNIALPVALSKIIKKPTSTEYRCYLIPYSNKGIHVVVSNPQGYLFYQNHFSDNLAHLVSHYRQFFDSILHRLSLFRDSWLEIEYWTYEALAEQNNSRFKRIKASATSLAEKYSTLQAVARFNSTQEICFDLFVEQVPYLYADFGELVYQKVARHILQQRQNRADYPIFITDLDLSAVVTAVGIIDNLEYKRRVEQKIALSMQRLLK